MKVYMVEVGIELPKGDIEYDNYQVDLNNKSWKALYDENVCAFDNKEQAIEFVNDYVDQGVPGTYGFAWEIEHELQDYEVEDFKNHCLLDVFYDREDVLYFKGGLENES